ncbi:hypothetical protein [Neobacillus ginsengisoli]|uniref:Uncharacterized protein n=1 Tax=Neobacillus ginsengisoli TaxID=904295 RepID=A0ABT9XNT7_9BACI|nr:hypothetical protein [Neobacillus ginsengisoli]MDQ0196935.1 hypothetical protein [Neobacillus ginsengisoli]
MNKKQRISWGVSFSSLALVAGMVSYLGLTNGDKTSNQITARQNSSSNKNTSQQHFNQNTDGSNQSFFDDNSTNSDAFSSNNGNSLDNGNNSQNQDSFGGGARQRGGFDTTTGGT